MQQVEGQEVDPAREMVHVPAYLMVWVQMKELVEVLELMQA